MASGSHLASNKQGAGNSGDAGRAASMSARQVFGAAGGGFAGKFSGRIGVAAAAWSSWAARIGIGGNLRFRGASKGQVRTAKSEWTAQVFDIGRFSGAAVQPDRLNSASLAFGQGVRPPRQRRPLPLPVADGRNQIGQKFPDRGQPRDNGRCKAEIGRLKGRGVLQAPLGSGVRAAPSAGVNGQSGCRPISRQNSGQTVGTGGGFALSCAKGVNVLRTLESGAGHVNQWA